MKDEQAAERIARQAHWGQKEQSTGDDFIHHIERVVTLVDSPDEKAVAWLHDLLEDTPWTEFELLAEGVSARIVSAVVWLTRTPPFDYATYIDRLRDSGDALAIAVKIADLRDHLRPNCPERLRPRYEIALPLLLAAAEARAPEEK